jgi:hypothetical protein
MEPYTVHMGRLDLKGLPLLEGLGSNIWRGRWELAFPTAKYAKKILCK